MTGVTLLLACVALAGEPAPAAQPVAPTTQETQAVEAVEADEAIEVAAVAAAAADDVVADEDRAVVASVKLGVDGRFGVSAGNVLLVPFVVPGPALGGDFSAQLLFIDHIIVGVDVAASVGLATDRADPAPLAGYRGRGRLGLITNLDRLVLQADVHAGVSSVALLPLPRVGVGGAAAWRAIDSGIFVWDIKGEIDLDLVVIAPAPGLGLSTGWTFRYRDLDAGVRVGVDADAIVAVVVNTVGAAAYLDLFVGARF